MIEAHDPAFRPLRQSDFLPVVLARYPFRARQAPFAVVGDPDGGDAPDLVVHGRSRADAVRLADLNV